MDILDLHKAYKALLVLVALNLLALIVAAGIKLHQVHNASKHISEDCVVKVYVCETTKKQSPIIIASTLTLEQIQAIRAKYEKAKRTAAGEEEMLEWLFGIEFFE